MISAFICAIALNSYAPAETHHFAYQGRLQVDAIEQIYKVNHNFDPLDIAITEINHKRLIAAKKAQLEALARRQAAEQARISAARRQQATARVATTTRPASPAVRSPVRQSRSDIILDGILSLKRLPQTGPVDGCAKVQKGLIMQGGFMLFTCEKLLPQYTVSEHEPTYQKYNKALLNDGWKRDSGSTAKELKFVRTDASGCKANLSLRLWTDRSMNEPPRPAADRDAHRQIVFLAKYFGKACDRLYPIAESLAAGR